MRARFTLPVLFLLAACTVPPPQETDALWQTFRQRCLTPLLRAAPFGSQGLVPVPPETVFPETATGVSASPLDRAFRPETGDWRLFVASDGTAGICAILSQKPETLSRQSARAWAKEAVNAKGFMYNHHNSSTVEKRRGDDWITVKLDAAVGWNTAFIASFKPLR